MRRTAAAKHTEPLQGGTPLVEQDPTGGHRPEVVVRAPATSDDPDGVIPTRDRSAGETLAAILIELRRQSTLLEILADESVSPEDE